MASELEFDPYNPNCPSRQLVDEIGDRWTVLTIGALGSGPARYGELSKTVAGISPRMLSRTLRSLERDGLISRRAYQQVPPKVVYELTESGRSLLPVLASLEAWAKQNMPKVLAARSEYDERESAN